MFAEMNTMDERFPADHYRGDFGFYQIKDKGARNEEQGHFAG
jgi:hypothetical protein